MIVVVHPHIVGAYWCITFDGHIYAYGGAKAFGGTGTPTDPKFNGAITSAAATITGNGLLIATAAKSLYVFGDAVKHGDPHGDPRT